MRKTFLKKGIREVWEHKFQYFFLILILALGIAAYGSFYNMADSRKLILDELFEESNFMDLRVEFQYGVTANESDVMGIMDDAGLSSRLETAEYRLSFDAFVNHTVDGEIKTTRALVIGYSAFEDGNLPQVNTPLFHGDEEYFSSLGAKECYIEHKFRDVYDVNIEDGINVLKSGRDYKLDILAHVDVPEYFFVIPEGSIFPSERSLCVLIMPRTTAQDLYAGPAENGTLVNELVITLKEDENIDDFMEDTEDAFQGAGIPAKAIHKDDNPSRLMLIEDYENDKENMMIFPMVIFIVSGFGLLIALRRMIRTHRVQIGIFKALGIPNGVVIRYFGFIGLLIALLSILFGWLLSIPIDSVFNNMLDNLYNFSVMRTSFSWTYFMSAGGIAVFLCLGCTVFPAWRALRIKPVDAIQSKEGISVSRAGKLAGKIGKMSGLPVALKLTLRNLIRRPRRTFSTVFGVALALSLFFSFAVALESMYVILNDTSSGNQWDYEVTLDGFAPSSVTAVWKGEHTSIEGVNPGLMLPASLLDGEDTVEGLMYAVDDVEGAYNLDMLKGKYEDGKVVVSQMMAEQESIKVGGKIMLMVPYRMGPVNYTLIPMELEVSGIQSNHMGPYFFADLDLVYGFTNLTGDANLIYLEVVDGEENIQLENYLITTPGVRSVTHISERQNLLEQYFDLFLQIMGVMGVISMLMAGAIVYNMFRINALESKREYATMKTLGTSLGRISKLIFIEGVFVTVLSIALGTLGGYYLAVYMMQAATDMGFDVPIVFSQMGFLATVVMIVVVIVLVSLLTIRFIGKITIADVIRERSE